MDFSRSFLNGLNVFHSREVEQTVLIFVFSLKFCIPHCCLASIPNPKILTFFRISKVAHVQKTFSTGKHTAQLDIGDFNRSQFTELNLVRNSESSSRYAVRTNSTLKEEHTCGPKVGFQLFPILFVQLFFVPIFYFPVCVLRFSPSPIPELGTWNQHHAPVARS